MTSKNDLNEKRKNVLKTNDLGEKCFLKTLFIITYSFTRKSTIHRVVYKKNLSIISYGRQFVLNTSNEIFLKVKSRTIFRGDITFSHLIICYNSEIKCEIQNYLR